MNKYNKNKSQIAIILALLCLVSSFSVSADTKTQITFSAPMTVAGNIATVSVQIKNNPGIAAFRFRLTYDTAALLLISVEKGIVLTDGTMVHDTNNAEQWMTFLWYATDNVYGDGEIAVLKFVPTADAKGDYPLSIKHLPEDILTKDKKAIDCTVSADAISVLGTNEFKYGDLNIDGQITSSDALLALKSAVGSIELNEKQSIIGNVDGERNITSTDALLILQFSVKKIDKFPIEK